MERKTLIAVILVILSMVLNTFLFFIVALSTENIDYIYCLPSVAALSSGTLLSILILLIQSFRSAGWFDD